MTLSWEGEDEDARAARRAAADKAVLEAGRTGDSLTLGNEFSEIRVSRAATRNGLRLLIESTRSGQWVALCPLELEALTWQNTATFAALIGSPFGPLLTEEEA
ncbi:hypothetical protein ACIPSJ_49850 [Streptomyces sp. NPDC090088]|uniref:hypothetical protein n=1 Tax=Streptomyces sp. NPDC090088 TaxID=3365944 RepID=UPI00380EE04C